MNNAKNDYKPIHFLSMLLMVLSTTFLLTLTACGPKYRDYYHDAQQALLRNDYGPARFFLEECDQRRPRELAVLHDLGVCSLMIAKERFSQMNHAAAYRELDRAISYFNAALDEQPNYFPSLKGLNIALELKGQFDDALAKAEWAAEFIGPSAEQFVYLAQELEERGDRDGALLRFRQAVAVEPDNADAHIAFAKFLMRVNNNPAAIYHLQEAYRINSGNQWVIDQLVERRALPGAAQPDRSTP